MKNKNKNKEIEDLQESNEVTEDSSYDYETEENISDLIDLVHCIKDYYNNQDNDEKYQEGDEWKRYAKQQENLDKNTIPDRINKLVEKSFIKQLKRFS